MSWTSSSTAAADYQLSQASEDTLTSIAIRGSRIVASSWAKDVRVWDIVGGSSATPKTMQSFPLPMLSCALDSSASNVVLGCTDGAVKLWDLQSNVVRDLGKHDAGVKECFWIPQLNAAVTGSWDKTVKWWDLRSPSPSCTVSLPDKVFCGALRENILVFGCGSKYVVAFDLPNVNTPAMTKESLLKMELRCVDIFHDKTGFIIGSSEARCYVQYFNEAQKASNFSFKCHRDSSTNLSYPLHAISVHPQVGTFLTAGGDGVLSVWDKASRHRVKQFPKKNLPITHARFSDDGKLIIYATGYDWAKVGICLCLLVH